MSRRRFYVPGDSIHEGAAVLPPDQAHHLRHVLRLRDGEKVEIFDGSGAGYSGRVSYRGDEVHVKSLREITAPENPQPELVLAQALLKADKFEWVLQKATELGVSGIVPLVTKFCDVRIPPSRIEGRMERWRRIVREAARQSCRFSVPGIRAPMTLAELFSLKKDSGQEGLLLYENAPVRWNGALPPAEKYMLCIGPEGGWHPDEAEAAANAGLALFNLGPRILRAETAALAAVTLIQFRIADFGLSVVD
jgi:16S rRNA (uracil1498-N3)-methyltransferase